MPVSDAEFCKLDTYFKEKVETDRNSKGKPSPTNINEELYKKLKNVVNDFDDQSLTITGLVNTILEVWFLKFKEELQERYVQKGINRY